MGFNIVNNTGIDLTQLIELAQELLSFSQEKVGWRRPPTLMLNSDPENAENPLGKTAHYNPETLEIVILVDKRHPKDILRSLSHELVHHLQNERGDFDRDFDTSLGYAQRDPHLRNMEAEAYETGNLCFRDFEDERKQLSESIYYTKPILGGEEDMSNDTKKPLKEWKNEEMNFRLMKKFGLIKEDVEAGAEQLFHDETTAEKPKLEEDEGGDDEEPESIKGAQEEHPLKEDATDDRFAAFKVPEIPKFDVSDISPPPAAKIEKRDIFRPVKDIIQQVKDTGVGGTVAGKSYEGVPGAKYSITKQWRFEEHKKNMDKQIILEEAYDPVATAKDPRNKPELTYDEWVAAATTPKKTEVTVPKVSLKKPVETIHKRNVTGKRIPHPNRLRGEDWYVEPGEIYSYEIPTDLPTTGDWGKGMTAGQLASQKFKTQQRDPESLRKVGREFLKMDWPITSDDPVRIPYKYDFEEDAWFPIPRGWRTKGPRAGEPILPPKLSFVRKPSGFETGYPGQNVYGPQFPEPQETAGEELAWAGAEAALSLLPIPVPKALSRLWPRPAPGPRGLTPRGQLRPDMPPPALRLEPPGPGVPVPGTLATPETLRTPLTYSAPGMSPEFATQPAGAFSWKRRYDPLPETVPPEMKAADDALQARNIPRPPDNQVWKRAQEMTEYQWELAEEAVRSEAEQRLGRELTDDEFLNLDWPVRKPWTSKEAYAAAYVDIVEGHLAYLADLKRGKGFKPSSRLNLLDDATVENARAAVKAKKPSLFKRIFKRKELQNKQVDDLTDELAAEMQRESPLDAPIEYFKPIAREQALRDLGVKKDPIKVGPERTPIKAGRVEYITNPVAEWIASKVIGDTGKFMAGRGKAGLFSLKEFGPGRNRVGWAQGTRKWFSEWAAGRRINPDDSITKGSKLDQLLTKGSKRGKLLKWATIGAGIMSTIEMESYLSEFIGDATDREKLENRLVWIWDPVKEQWYDPNRPYVEDVNGRIVAYYVGTKTIRGKSPYTPEAADQRRWYDATSLEPRMGPVKGAQLLDYNGNAYVFSSLTPPAPPPEDCDPKLCWKVFGPPNSRRIAMPKSMMDDLLYGVLHDWASPTGDYPVGEIQKERYDLIRANKDLRGHYVLTPWAKGVRDIMIPGERDLRQPELEMVSYGGPIAERPMTYDRQGNELIVAGSDCGPEDPEADGHKKECWDKVPRYMGRGRWKVLENIPGIGRRELGENIQWKWHPYFISKSVLNDDFGGWKMDPVFTSNRMQDWVGGKRIPYIDKPLAYTVVSFDEKGNWVFERPADVLKIETPEDYRNALVNELLFKYGLYDKTKTAEENAKSEKHKKAMEAVKNLYNRWFSEEAQKFREEYPNVEISDDDLKKYFTFDAYIGQMISPSVVTKKTLPDGSTVRTIDSRTGLPIDPKAPMVFDPTQPPGEMVSQKTVEDIPMMNIRFKYTDSDEINQKRVPAFRVEGSGIGEVPGQNQDPERVCYKKHPDEEGLYQVQDVECLFDREYILGSPRSRAPAKPRTPQPVPSPKELRKPAPRRNDVPYSWE